jgi:hypothetical protein
MKVRTFNIVFTVLVILFIGYSIVCAVLAVHSEPLDSMPWYAVVWIAYAVLSSVWLLIVGSRDTSKKQVYHLKDEDSIQWLHDPNDEEFWMNYPDYPDYVNKREN